MTRSTLAPLLLGLLLALPAAASHADPASVQSAASKRDKDKSKDKDKGKDKDDEDDTPVRPSTAGSSTRAAPADKDTGAAEMIPPPTPLSKVLIVDGQRVHMLEAGWDKHEWLIVLPGFPEPAIVGQKLLDPLSERFHTLVVDPQGFGYSAAPDWVSYSPQGMADFVLRLMDHLEIDKAHLAGFDLGGVAAIRFAYDHPERLHSLIVGAAPVYPDRYTGLLADAQVPISGEQVFARLLPRLKEYLRDGMSDPSRYDDQLATDLFVFLKDKDTKQCLRQWILTTGSDLYTMERWYEQIELPVLLVWGADDPYIPVGQADELVQQFPEARLKVVDGAGHFLLLEKPRAVAAALVDHVYEPPPPAPPFTGLSFTGFRGQVVQRTFTVLNHREKKVEVTCAFDGAWTDADGGTVESANVTIDPAEAFEIEPAESAEVTLEVSLADRALAIETIYLGEIACAAIERRTDIETTPVPIRLQIPNLGEELPEGFGPPSADEPVELDVGELPLDELIEVE